MSPVPMALYFPDAIYSADADSPQRIPSQSAARVIVLLCWP